MQMSSENIRCVIGMQNVSSFHQKRRGEGEAFQKLLLNDYTAIYDLETIFKCVYFYQYNTMHISIFTSTFSFFLGNSFKK